MYHRENLWVLKSVFECSFINTVAIAMVVCLPELNRSGYFSGEMELEDRKSANKMYTTQVVTWIDT